MPSPIPAANFWSLTLYDALTASGLDNGQPFPSLNSHDHPTANADGSFDLYVGPAAPPGKEANWLKTVLGKGYFTILRLYGPTEAFLDQTGGRMISKRRNEMWEDAMKTLLRTLSVAGVFCAVTPLVYAQQVPLPTTAAQFLAQRQAQS